MLLIDFFVQDQIKYFPSHIMLLHFAGVCTITHSTLYRIRLNNVLKFKIDFNIDNRSRFSVTRQKVEPWIREQWIAIVKCKTNSHSRICSRHFEKKNATVVNNSLNH